MKKWLSLLLACLLMMSAAAAEETVAALPEVALDFGEEAEVWEEQNTDTIVGKSYAINGWYVVLASESGEYTAQELCTEMAGGLPEDAAVIENENGVTQRISGELGVMDAVVDVTTIWRDGCTVYMFVMATGTELESVTAQADAWLAAMTINGEAAVAQPEENAAE